MNDFHVAEESDLIRADGTAADVLAEEARERCETNEDRAIVDAVIRSAEIALVS